MAIVAHSPETTQHITDLYGDQAAAIAAQHVAICGDAAARQAFRQGVSDVADKAKVTLPDCAARVDAAVKMVLAGDVSLVGDGTAKVASQSNGRVDFLIVNGHCDCRDFAKAPSGWCKHRIAAGLQKRAHAALDVTLSAQDDSPEASADLLVEPADLPTVPPAAIPPQYLVTLHGKAFILYTGLLAMAHARGLTSLKAHFISVTSELALAEAEATFADGSTYGESADSTPQNVGATVRAHFPRIALTRAKARCLRDALNIGICSFEELAD